MKKALSIIVVLMLVAALVLPGTHTAAAATGSFSVVSDTSVMVTRVNGTPVSRPAVEAWEPYLDESSPTPATEPDNSYWDTHLTGHVFSGGADWIWESYRTSSPHEGDVVYFEKTFNVNGTPTAGTLWITCDNGYEAWLNGEMVATAQLTGDWEDPHDPHNPHYLWQEFVDYDNWESVESVDVSSFLIPGDNVLLIKAANEHMDPDDSPNGGVGTTYSNPAGLIFQMDVSYGLGSTRTWGYWKTHSSFGSAPRDDAWNRLPNHEDTMFFSSGQTYRQVLETNAAGGAAYYQLAHQYIAAQLNGLNGAWMGPDVETAFALAKTLLSTCAPGEVEGFKKTNKAVWAQFNELAGILDSYNNGLMGTPHAG